MDAEEERNARITAIRLIAAMKRLSSSRIGLQEMQALLVISGFSCAGVDLISHELQEDRVQTSRTLTRLMQKKLIRVAGGETPGKPGVRYALTQKAIPAVQSLTSETIKAIKRAAPYGRLRAGKKS